VTDVLHTNLDKILEEIPPAIWSPGQPLPYIYRGSPLEMVKGMASEMGPGVTPDQAMNRLLAALASSRKLHICIAGDPPEHVKASVFVYALLQHGLLRPMPQA
jgi:hypothetical protein